jgi:hypothetical protein
MVEVPFGSQYFIHHFHVHSGLDESQDGGHQTAAAVLCVDTGSLRLPETLLGLKLRGTAQAVSEMICH